MPKVFRTGVLRLRSAHNGWGTATWRRKFQGTLSAITAARCSPLGHDSDHRGTGGRWLGVVTICVLRIGEVPLERRSVVLLSFSVKFSPTSFFPLRQLEPGRAPQRDFRRRGAASNTGILLEKQKTTPPLNHASCTTRTSNRSAKAVAGPKASST